MNKMFREDQTEKLRALIDPLSAALAVAPEEPEYEENEIWVKVDDLLASLEEFFDELAVTQEDEQREVAIYKLLEELAAGKCPGVKGATAYKIQKFAAERGFV